MQKKHLCLTHKLLAFYLLSENWRLNYPISQLNKICPRGAMSNRRHSPIEDQYCCPTKDKGCCPTENKGYCPTEDKNCCPTEDKGYCPTEDKG
jgi:hypothetical protein